jgi:hypothetical protein
VNRRRPAVAATVCALIALSSCATFKQNDVAARVGDRTLSPKAAQALIGADAQTSTGDQLRAKLTAWIKVGVLDQPQAEAQYEKGIAGPAVCLAAIPVASIDATAPIMAALQSGMSFADAARQFSATPALADSGGVVLAADGTECMPPAGLAPAVADALKTTPVGQPVAADLQTFAAVLLLRPFKDLALESQAVVAATGVPADQLSALFANAKVYVDPRYGRWDSQTGSVVPLSS